jgi:hypothetical protein
MKKIIIRISIFLIPLIILGGGFELSLRNIPNDYIIKNAYLKQHANNIQVLFLGSSHAYRGINPEYISFPSYNAAYISQSIDLDYEITMKYKNEFSNLKYIVLPISYFTLFGNLSNGKESWRQKNYCIYYDICSSKDIKNHFEILSSNLKTNIEKYFIYYIKKEIIITTDSNGYGVFKGTSELNESGIEAAKRHTKENFSLYETNFSLLNKIINYSKNKKINLILYTPPAYITYREKLNREQLNLTISTIENLVRKESKVFYLNLLNSESFKSEDFYNADHLNEIGAEKLTHKINNYINKIENEQITTD